MLEDTFFFSNQGKEFRIFFYEAEHSNLKKKKKEKKRKPTPTV